MVILAETCVVCGRPLPIRGNRRVSIPWLHGRKKLVHAECVDEVARQATIPEGRAA